MAGHGPGRGRDWWRAGQTLLTKTRHSAPCDAGQPRPEAEPTEVSRTLGGLLFALGALSALFKSAELCRVASN
jgi:hypothetical protein